MRKPTDAQKAAAQKKREAFRALAQKVSAMDQDEKQAFMKSFPAVATIEGHVLSNSNMMLVLMQNSQATIVGGFRQWIKAGRVVRKGQHGVTIWVPSASGKTDESGEADLRFLTATVFDIAQTDAMQAEEVA